MRRVCDWALLTTLVLPMNAFAQSDPESLQRQALATERAFARIWSQESPGVWRIVFDRVSPLSEADRVAVGEKTVSSPAAVNAPTGY